MTDRKKTLIAYWIVICVIAMQFVPVITLQVLSIFLLLALYCAIPAYRRTIDPASGFFAHLTWLNRSLWLWSFLLSAGIGIAALFISTIFEYSEFINAINDLTTMNTQSPLVQKFVWISIAAVTPSFLYLGWRLLKGVRAAIKGIPLENPKSLI